MQIKYGGEGWVKISAVSNRAQLDSIAIQLCAIYTVWYKKRIWELEVVMGIILKSYVKYYINNTSFRLQLHFFKVCSSIRSFKFQLLYWFRLF